MPCSCKFVYHLIPLFVCLIKSHQLVVFCAHTFPLFWALEQTRIYSLTWRHYKHWSAIYLCSWELIILCDRFSWGPWRDPKTGHVTNRILLRFWYVALCFSSKCTCISVASGWPACLVWDVGNCCGILLQRCPPRPWHIVTHQLLALFRLLWTWTIHPTCTSLWTRIRLSSRPTTEEPSSSVATLRSHTRSPCLECLSGSGLICWNGPLWNPVTMLLLSLFQLGMRGGVWGKCGVPCSFFSHFRVSFALSPVLRSMHYCEFQNEHM